MAEPITAASSLKNLVKNPLFYLIAVFVFVGGYIVKESPIGPAWFVGLGLLIFACLMFLIHVIASLFDVSFKRRYDGALNAQEKTIVSQSKVINHLSKNTINAFGNMSTASDTISGGYTRPATQIKEKVTTSTSDEV